MKKLVTLLCVMLALALVPVKAQAAVRPETGVIVGTYYGRNADCGIVTVELSDGNQYDVPHPGEDWYRGDIVAVNRDTKGTPMAEDDEVSIVAYLGYEVWYPEHQWIIGDYSYNPLF